MKSKLPDNWLSADLSVWLPEGYQRKIVPVWFVDKAEGLTHSGPWPSEKEACKQLAAAKLGRPEENFEIRLWYPTEEEYDAATLAARDSRRWKHGLGAVNPILRPKCATVEDLQRKFR